MEIQIHTIHELHIPVNAVSGERKDSLKHTETAKETHTQMTLAETY